MIDATAGRPMLRPSRTRELVIALFLLGALVFAPASAIGNFAGGAAAAAGYYLLDYEYMLIRRRSTSCRTFPIRTCSDNKLGRHEKLGKPCLLFHIEKCSGPCVGEIDKTDYDELVQELIDFLDGDTDTIVERLETEMRMAADDLEFSGRHASTTGWRRCARPSPSSRWWSTRPRTST